MVIRASSASQVKGLVDALVGGDELQRESAIARLSILGPRATDRLVSAFETAADPSARIALLRAMDAIGDQRAMESALHALKDGGDVALAGTSVLRTLLRSSRSATRALDALLSATLDRTLAVQVRLACLEALRDAPGDTFGRVAEALEAETDAPSALVECAETTSGDLAAAERVWDEATGGRLTEDAAALLDVFRRRAGSAPLTALQKLIDTIRAKESTISSPRARTEWRSLRGTLHQTLARRGSRVALYDLRETIGDAAEPLPVSYLAALHALGDATCLEPLAAAYARADPNETWWREQLASAFRTIVRRERMTKRHGVLKRIHNRWPAAAAEIAAQ